uniref:Uncharacterized protein n=1 Tax=Setaria italica TaxID=4555 RepID=K3YNV3_SETIT
MLLLLATYISNEFVTELGIQLNFLEPLEIP